MLRVGLTGGLASGKSFVAGELAALGCTIISADALGHAVIEEEGREEVIAAFGTTDRKEIAAQVFSDPAALARLNAIVHPHVFARQERLIAAAEPRAIIVVEAAIMIESGSWRRYDKLLIAACGEAQQIERAAARGMSRQDAIARIRNQMPLAEKRKFADYVIETSGTEEHTRAQVRTVFEALREVN